MGYRDGLKFTYTKMDALAALDQKVSALLGVTDLAESTLKKLGIKTIYDLASSPLFQMAQDIAQAASGEGSSLAARSGRISSSFIDQDSPATPASLVSVDIAELREISDALAAEIKSNLQVETVGDLGRWLPFGSAKTILNAAIPNLDQEEANELVPKLGEYPTERHYYRSLVIDHVSTQQTTDLESAGAIDISPTVSADFGFNVPAVGAMLTFAQSWYAQGVTLGNLLHSVALAPGESTRIAVMDWTRQTKASGIENISESEQLSNTTNHNRAISEVQEAVASEVQSGFSKTSGSSTTSAGGGGLGLSIGPLTLGGSGSSATTSSSGESFTSSAGTRNLAATMNQRVSDSTQQAASSVRDRRASIVKEVSEEEHQSVSTRIIANYNHMHALTVQYYEVIEIYRVNVQLHQVERCLFVPVKLITFDNKTIERYLGVLANAALNKRARELLSTEFGTVTIESTLPLKRTPSIFDRVGDLDRITLNNALTATSTESESNTNALSGAREAANASLARAGVERVNVGSAIQPSIMEPAAWVKDELIRASRITCGTITKPGTSAVYLPGETEFSGLSLTLTSQNNTPVSVTNIKLVTQSSTTLPMLNVSSFEWSINDPIPIQELSAIRISSTNTSYVTGKMTMQLVYGSAKFPISIPIEITPNAADLQVCRFSVNEGQTELKIHLNQNRLYYSQAIWRSLDPSQIALLLSAYSFEGKPIADLIDPNPVMVAGNYLVFRMPSFTEAVGIESPREDNNEAYNEWKAWLRDRGLVLGAETAMEQLIPIPTGGVFAEAVLGRSNSAEKLDATRFWNWQDSPIPLQPPEIAAIQMESRAQPIDVTPGQLGAPVVNIMNPTSLPDPAGLGAVLNAVQNGNMFRDMSGIAASAALAQALANNSTSAGVEAGKQASANLVVAAQKDIEEKKIAAQLALAAMGIPSANGGSAKNISESGALLNTAKEMDKQSPRTGAGSDSNAAGEGGMSDGSNSTDGSDGSNGSATGDYMPGVEGSLPSGSRADEVFSKMNWGSLGQSVGSIIPASYSSPGGGGGGSGSSSSVINFELACYANFPRPWPDEASEVQGLANAKWIPSGDDFDSISPAATSANNQGTKPNGLVMTSLADLIGSVTYFAPKVPGFGTTHAARVVRLNLFLYSDGSSLGFLGTLDTTGKWDATLDPNAGINAAGLDSALITAISKKSANKALLAKLKKAWAPNAEIWLYTASGTVSDALAKKFAKLMGAVVKTFNEPFWVLPTYDTAQQKILTREEFGIGSDFSSAMQVKTKVLHNLDSLATRKFNP